MIENYGNTTFTYEVQICNVGGQCATKTFIINIENPAPPEPPKEPEPEKNDAPFFRGAKVPKKPQA